VLVRNASAEPARTELRLPRWKRGPLFFLDAVSGSILAVQPDREGWVSIELAPRDSIFVVAGLPLAPTAATSLPGKFFLSSYVPSSSEASNNRLAPIAALQRWDLEVVGDDVAGGRVTLSETALFDWRDDARLRLVSSPGRYRTTIDVAAVESGAPWVLDLGRVIGAADVAVNGAPVETLLYSPFVADITGALRPGTNTIEVTVRSPLLNRFIGLAERGDSRYSRFKGRPPIAGGLLGPVVVSGYGGGGAD
jgi:hypothetical protein